MAYGSEVEKLERRWMENPMGVSFAPLAEAYRRAGDQPRALEVLAIGLANHPAYVPALIVQARCHLDVHADGAAEESFLAVLASDAHNLIARKGLADICERSGRPETAVQHLERLLEADPTHDEGRIQLDRVTAAVAARAAEAGLTEPSAASASEAQAPEPAGFEPTAMTFDDPAALEDIALGLDPVSETAPAEDPEEPAGVSLVEKTETESSNDPAETAPPVDGLEVGEPEFQFEKEIDPFEAAQPEDSEPPAEAAPPEEEHLMVPFEEELPAAWLERTPSEPVEPEDVVEDEPARVEPEAAGDLEPDRREHAEHPPEPEADREPEAGGAFWAPTAAPWIPAADDPAGEGESAASAPSPEVEDGATPSETSSPPESPSEAGLTPAPAEPEEKAASETSETILEDAPAMSWQGVFSTSPVPGSRPEVPGSIADAKEAAEEQEAELPEAELPEAEAATGDNQYLLSEETSPAVPSDTSPVAVDTAGPGMDGETTEEVLPPPAESAEPDPIEDEGPVVVDGAELEFPADPEPEFEPALVMTATMARVFERQGHQTMALAIYAQLAEQDPDDADLAAEVTRLSAALGARSGGPGHQASGDGAAPRPAVKAILGHLAESSAPDQGRAPEETESGLRLDAPATRASEDVLSLSAVFGSSRPVVESTIFTPGAEPADREPSFDEFFEDEGASPSGSAPAGPAGGEDLEQFTAWLRSLKR